MTDGGTGLAARLRHRLLAPHDAAALALLRIAFGLMVTVSAARFLAYGWVDRLYVQPRFHFKYWAFSWVPALPEGWIHGLFVLLGGLGLAVALGLFYRVAVALLTLTFAWLQLMDVSNYLNHYYLVTLLGALLVVIPAHRTWSLDAWRKPGLAGATVPAWCTYLLRFQVATVYICAGLAKFNTDWLLHAQPLGIWLSSRTSVPVIGPWLDQPWVAFVAAWAGFLFDTTIVLFLSLRRTRAVAYLVVLLFHALTSLLFPIGMFPVIMTTAALVFFSPSWPRDLMSRLRRRPAPRPAAGPAAVTPTPRLYRPALALAALYCLIQIALPLRAHLYGGDVSWHEQGMRLSWRVMTREKNGSVTFIVIDAQARPPREWHIPPSRYLTRLQEREMAVQPDLILQLAHRIARDFAAQGHPGVAVYADARVSLNGRPAATFIDPGADLARLDDGLAAKPWILPAPGGPPIRLRPLLATRR
ncbi:MAG: HTTM domain-containing protein [Deltaproteobacteria bacterium]|nr:HTTM domain-containing protein [Deltaproteobacteria bacterium]